MLSNAYTHAASTSSCSAGVHARSISYSPLLPAGAPGIAAPRRVALLALKTKVASSGGTIGRPADAGAAAVSKAKPPPRASVGEVGVVASILSARPASGVDFVRNRRGCRSVEISLRVRELRSVEPLLEPLCLGVVLDLHGER